MQTNQVFNEKLLIAKNFKIWKHWRKIKNGFEPKDFKIGCGYYLTVSLIGNNPIGKVREFKMKSGKIGIYKLIDYTTFSDPTDMIKESWWHFVGYEGQKSLKDCSFSEALSLYYA